VNVAIYAIAIGQRVGLPRKLLSQLGLAGYFMTSAKRKFPWRFSINPKS